MTYNYCIKCEVEHGNNYFPAPAVTTNNPDEAVECCHFEMGIAYCPPEEFDMDEFVESVEYEEEPDADVELSDVDEFWYEAYFLPFVNEAELV